MKKRATLKNDDGDVEREIRQAIGSRIAELRRKLEDDPSQPRHILTVWKAGYRLEP